MELPRLRSSVLLKVVVALVLALLVSSTITSAVASRLTRSALADKAREFGSGQLNILEEAYAERDNTLVVNLRNLAQILNARGLFDPQQRNELIAELGRASANLDLDILRVLDDEGRELVPPAGVAGELADPESIKGNQSESGSSRLFLTRRDTFVQATSVPTLAGERKLLLIGGYDFDDQFAYRLRKQVGNVDDVILVGAGRVVGSTLTDPPQRPPAPPGGRIPTSPTVVEINGEDRMVAYVHVGPQANSGGASIGLVLADPVGALDQSLARTRLAATALLTAITLAMAWLLFHNLVRPLVRLARTAGDIAAGDLDASFDAGSRDEIGTLARVLERMRLELRTKLDLIASQADDLRESSQRIVAAEDNERHRVARDLHDGLQQQLVVLRMQVTMAEESVVAQGAGPSVVDCFQAFGRDLDRAIEQLRKVTQNLYPSILLDRGLAAATRSYVGRLPVYTRLKCEPEALPRLAPEIESAAYFLLCEAVTNALKHSGSTEISITLQFDGDWIVVAIADNGRGFIPERVERRGGLLHMQDRVRSFGGDLEFTSAPGLGVRVQGTFPARPASDGARTGPVAALPQVTPRSSAERTGLPRPAG